MESSKISETYSLNRSTYINLRWIGILGQLVTINSVKFIFDFDFDFIIANLIIFIGAISNIFLMYYYNKIQLSNRSALSFLLIDMKTDGIKVNPIISIDNHHSLNEVEFVDVRVPKENLIGEENKGWTYAKSLLAHERTGIACL